MCDPTYWGTTLFFTACYFSAGLAIIPTVWFIFHGQSAAASLGIWVTLAALVHAINSTVWRKDVVNRSPIWCDISSQIILIYSTGAICSCVCIAKFLAFVLSPSARNISHEERRRINIRNYVFSLGFPISMIPFHYLYSPSRFGLVRTMGCEASYVLTWPTFFFFIIWSPIFGYVGYKLYQWKWKNASPKNSTKLPIVRLAWLCITYTTAAVPLSIYYLIETLFRGSYSSFSINKIRANSAGIEYERYKSKPTFYDVLPLMGSGIYIMFFTFSAELRTVYKQCFWKGISFFKSAFRTKRNPKEHSPKAYISSHTRIQVDFDYTDTEMTGMPAQDESRYAFKLTKLGGTEEPNQIIDLESGLRPSKKRFRLSLTRIPTTRYPASPSPDSSGFEDIRFSQTSSDQTLCSSPNALTQLITKTD
ncbi:hypothetical protein MJO28_000397 [Puccinia striiformis f. sp. tritici]|uniref:Uncharacterized protein n=1 Tax=Puccinia striiformis f. sp. tritici TaxID=168172 RepID=A0ACC0F0Q8_9BASI|nr:hypothetical protein MJO28_000397 [Puccinia striiformis f. sp. tritici]